MEKQDIIDYIRETPENTNSSVMLSMLNALPGGGGEDPVLENAKETGGIGWTEENKTQLIPETTVTANTYGQATVVFDVDFEQLYNTYTDQSVLKGKLNGAEYEVGIFYEYDGGVYQMFMRDTDIQLIQGESNKTSFSVTGMNEGDTYTIEVYADASVVHTINSKYVGGGMMVVNAVMSSGGDSFTMDKTYDEINAAFPNVLVSFRNSEYDPNQYIYEPLDKIEGAFVSFQCTIFGGQSEGRLGVTHNQIQIYPNGDTEYSTVNCKIDLISANEPL